MTVLSALPGVNVDTGFHTHALESSDVGLSLPQLVGTKTRHFSSAFGDAGGGALTAGIHRSSGRLAQSAQFLDSAPKSKVTSSFSNERDIEEEAGEAKAMSTTTEAEIRKIVTEANEAAEEAVSAAQVAVWTEAIACIGTVASIFTSFIGWKMDDSQLPPDFQVPPGASPLPPELMRPPPGQRITSIPRASVSAAGNGGATSSAAAETRSGPSASTRTSVSEKRKSGLRPGATSSASASTAAPPVVGASASPPSAFSSAPVSAAPVPTPAASHEDTSVTAAEPVTPIMLPQTDTSAPSNANLMPTDESNASGGGDPPPPGGPDAGMAPAW